MQSCLLTVHTMESPIMCVAHEGFCLAHWLQGQSVPVQDVWDGWMASELEHDDGYVYPGGCLTQNWLLVFLLLYISPTSVHMTTVSFLSLGDCLKREEGNMLQSFQAVL